MSQLIVLSAIGTDRTGVVQDITKVIMACGGNIEESRMTTLGAEFAMLMLVSGNWHTLGKLERELEKLGEGDNLTFSIRKTGERQIKEDRMPYAVDAVSLDHQGIVFGLANFFASHDVEIADVATRSYAAAHTGAPMFAVQMAVNIPSSVHISQLREEFHELCDRLNLDAILEPVKA
ncbi:MAG: glycine cleavage system protein R [Gammaproteobacteria bacterium]|nr:glycine cleavage system protein R [Gammaproteobacteria bacterium]MDH3372008.1 glycine cleavage system protein R [Gammaproteobacteria bacterium]MDH3408544.1 glycine cleavage system protein R [Gammaproteobacteria bacterium]MDH3552048.1 glycine cleavage system protein R [Gammaproteobacteria bacterium]